MTTALVLGAGGLTGQAFHLGVLTALSELAGFDGRRADIVVGTSAGSMVAASLRAGLSATDQAAMLHGDPVSAEGSSRLEALREQFQTPDSVEPAPAAFRRRPLAPAAVLALARHPWSVRPGAAFSGLLPAGRTSTSSIQRSVASLHGPKWPDPGLRVCAVRARDARRVVFGTDLAPPVDVGTAVAASCAIPGYFAPVVIAGEAYVDGGGHSPTNADVLAADRPDLVVVSSPMSFGPGGVRTPDALVRLAVRGYLSREVRLLRRGGAAVLVFQPSRADLTAMGWNPMRLMRGPDIIAAAAATVRARLEARPELSELLASR